MDATSKNRALELCAELVNSGLGNVIGLAMGEECSWASYLLIGTATSRVHMLGAAERTRKAMREMGMESSGSAKKTDDDSWKIIDGIDIVVSLMDSEAREFYALEERWFEADVIFNSDEGDEAQSSISS